jgi:hypothetical protein
MLKILKETLKEYKEECALLPAGVKIFFATLILFASGFAVYYGVGNFIADRKIQRLEKQNQELSAQSQSAMEKAAKAEINAANEALRVESLENQIKAFEAKEKLTDEKYQVQSQKSSNLRLNLNRVRSSQPANTSTDELERQLCARYGCGEKNGN